MLKNGTDNPKPEPKYPWRSHVNPVPTLPKKPTASRGMGIVDEARKVELTTSAQLKPSIIL